MRECLLLRLERVELGQLLSLFKQIRLAASALLQLPILSVHPPQCRVQVLEVIRLTLIKEKVLAKGDQAGGQSRLLAVFEEALFK